MVLDVNILNSFWPIAGVIVSFLVVLVALGLGVSSIIQTNNIFKKQRRDSWLRDIRQWAEEIHSNFAPDLFAELRGLIDRYYSRVYEKGIDVSICNDMLEKERNNLLHDQLTRVEIRINESIIRSGYILNLSSALDDNLSKKVYKLSVHLNARKKHVRKRFEALDMDEPKRKAID